MLRIGVSYNNFSEVAVFGSKCRATIIFRESGVTSFVDENGEANIW